RRACVLARAWRYLRGIATSVSREHEEPPLMPKPLDPILGPDGKRLWVTAREYIGAEEVNAACEWTQRVHRALTREHSDGDMYGHHKRAFHPIGAVRFLMPRWLSGSVEPGRIYPDSFLLGRTERDFPGTFGISDVSLGVF